ncbi:hypothetical protein [Aquimarina aquimarini]|uniref:hypothetical protein n=1 Tax=Aquimarina aquimarini TaxID=1191734 RepID=UPI000D562956|nr:hypothetical protein [Aquimarina aquimarini]
MIKYIYILILVFLTLSCGTQKVITKKDLLYSSTPENLDKFGTFIWAKNKNDSIVINKKNLDIIKLKKGMHYKSLVIYTFSLTRSKYIIENLTFSERSKTLAYLIYYIKENSIEPNIIEYTILDDKNFRYYNEFEKHNYYNLPNFKNEYREKFEKLKPPKKLEPTPVINIIDKSD